MPKVTINPAPGNATAWTFGGKLYLPGTKVDLTDDLAEKFKARGIIGEIKHPPTEVAVPTIGTGDVPTVTEVEVPQETELRARAKGRNARIVS